MASVKDQLTGFIARRPNLASFGLWPRSKHEGEQEETLLCRRAEGHVDPAGEDWGAHETLHKDWAQLFQTAAEQLATLAGSRREQFMRLASLEQEVRALHARVDQLRDSQSIVVPIATLDPDPFELLRDIQVVVQPTEDGYLATFFDANIGMTGDTREEAVANLRELIVDVFDELEQEEGRLGPHPARQLRVLRSLMRRRGS